MKKLLVLILVSIVLTTSCTSVKSCHHQFDMVDGCFVCIHCKKSIKANFEPVVN
jgi:hypothetical protein